MFGVVPGSFGTCSEVDRQSFGVHSKIFRFFFSKKFRKQFEKNLEIYFVRNLLRNLLRNAGMEMMLEFTESLDAVAASNFIKVSQRGIRAQMENTTP